jgi:ABC-type uncharacterized transport system involved in gliding motility auxiliary subunit
MKKKQIDLFLFSTVGVVVCLVIVIGLNVIANFVKLRVDLTAEKLFTLSEGTKQILQELDTPVDIRFYATRDDKIMPPQLKTYVSRVEDLLEEFAENSDGNINLTKFDPQPDSDAEDSARLDGVEGQSISLTDRIYLGMAVSMLDETVAIPFLDPSKERQLEYEIARAVSQIVTIDKPIIGVMSSLPAFGQPANPMMAQMGRAPQAQEPWAVISQLKQDFEVKEVQLTADTIDEDITVLIVIHPKEITEATEYAIDQFVLRGGKLLAFLDALALIDQQPNPNNMMGSPPSTSNLTKLLPAWGLEFNSSKVVADMSFAKEVSFRQGSPPQLQPSVLFVNDKGINGDDVVTAQIDQLLMPFVGTFSGTPADGLEQTILINTTAESQLVDGFMAQLSGAQIAKEFSAEGKELTVAMRLTGKFKTAFPDGKPDAAAAAGEDDIDKEDEAPAIDSLKESEEEGTVVLFGDADFLFDSFSVRIQNFLGTRMLSLLNGNLPVAQNVVEQLAGDNRLIRVRSRAAMNRPFTTIRDMQIQAEKEYRTKIQGLEDTLQQTQTKLSELQSQRTDVSQGQRFVLSEDQQKELEKFRKQQVDTNKQLKTMRRDLRKDIDALETKLKWVNIAGMPFIITIGGILIATIKRKRTAAR